MSGGWTHRTRGYGHRITYIDVDHFRLSWTWDAKYPSSRLRFPRTITRDTDYDGAYRFAMKWKLKAPSAFKPEPT